MSAIVNLEYDVKNDLFEVSGNVKNDKIEEVLSEFLRSQLGAGRDDTPPNEKDKYQISIQLDLADDSFHVTSDTGNHGLTAGIVMYFLQTRPK